MGWLDFLPGRRAGGGVVGKHAARATNKRAQNADRYDSIVALAELETREAVEALLPRFDFRIDPSIVDQEEKDIAFEGCVAAGAAAVDPVKDAIRDAKEVGWLIKILERIVSEEELVSELLRLLSSFSTEYERDPKKKIQAIAHLEVRNDPRIVKAVAPFLEDMNDEVRFHVVRTMFAQQDTAAEQDTLVKHMAAEDSVRIRVRIAEGFEAAGWNVPEADRSAFGEALPETFALDPATGAIRKAE